jgi:adenylate cyclase
MGTAPYMSPEQIRGQAVDPRTDIWAFGCVLFEMLTGQRAFHRETMADTMAAILAREPDWGALPDDTSPAIRTLIRKSLEKDTSERQQDMSSACLEIHTVLTSGAAAVTPAEPASRKRGVLALAAVGVVGLVLLTAATALNVGGLRELVMRGPWGIGAVTVAGSGERPRIVVLPFKNLGGEQEEYFSEGITYDISTQISKIGNFVVIAPGSARRASSAGGGYREMAQQLAVDYVIDGSVSHAGDRVRITASLIDPETDEQLWANDYDRELSVEHIFNVRSDVAQQVAGALDVTLSPADQVQLSEQPTQNLEAYQQYQLGRFFWDKRTSEGFELAIGHFEQAIALDPDYALAHAGLANTHLLLPWFSSQYSNELGLARSEEAARTALSLDPSLGEAHTTLGLVYEWQFRWDAAEREFKRAIELSPGYPTAHHWYADMLARLGRHEEAIAQINTALELDPLSLIINQDVGFVLQHAGQTEAAIRQYRRTLELEPTFPATRLVLAMTLLAEGEFDEAENELGRWAEVTGNDPMVLRHLAELAARHARSGETQPLPPALDLEAVFPPFAVSVLYLLTGHHETVLDRFEQAYEENLFAVAFALTWPPFERLSYDPRYAELKRRMGFES